MRNRACWSGKQEIIEKLVTNGIPVDQENNCGMTSC